MTVEELEKMQFLEAEKARQQLDHQKQQHQRQSAAAAAAVADMKAERHIEQLKVALLQQMQQRQQQQQQSDDGRRLLADNIERQRQEEIRRRQEKADELRRQQQLELLRSLSLSNDPQSFQMALTAVSNGFGVTAPVDQTRREFMHQTQDSLQMASAVSNYWLPKEAPAAKSVAGIQHWHNPTAASTTNFPHVHSKMATESSSWEDLAASLPAKGAVASGMPGSQMLSGPRSMASQPSSKTLKDEAADAG
jgi:hypothetical protein